jgi:hypothetical protein
MCGIQARCGQHLLSGRTADIAAQSRPALACAEIGQTKRSTAGATMSARFG